MVELTLVFEDAEEMMTAKKIIETQSDSSRATEYLLMYSYFDDVTNLLKEI